MPSMKNLKDFAEIIEPSYVDDTCESVVMGGGILDVDSGEFDISRVNPIEVPMVDGSIGVFDNAGEFMGYKN